MIPSRRLLALVCAVTTLGVGAVTAGPTLAAGNAIINDCQAHGQLTRPYTVNELRHALNIMPATVKQYTSCFDVVQNALVSARKHNGVAPASGSAGSGGSGSFLPTWVIVILVVLVLAAVTFGALAIRRRRTGAGSDGPVDEAPTRIEERRDDDERV